MARAKQAETPSDKTSITGPIYIEYWPLSKVQPALRNPKLHDLDEIAASIQRFGFVRTPVVNEATGRLVAGHGTLESLAQLKSKKQPVPQRIVAREDDWYFPVERGVSFVSDMEAEAYLLADNRLTLVGGFDNQSLAEALKDLAGAGFQGTGYTQDDLTALNSIWGRTELVQFTAFVDPQPPVMKFRVVIPNLTELKAKKLAREYKDAFVEQYREK